MCYVQHFLDIFQIREGGEDRGEWSPLDGSQVYQPVTPFPGAGDRVSLREKTTTHPIQKLYDDLRPQRQPWGQLYDHHDSHLLSRKEKYRRE